MIFPVLLGGANRDTLPVRSQTEEPPLRRSPKRRRLRLAIRTPEFGELARGMADALRAVIAQRAGVALGTPGSGETVGGGAPGVGDRGGGAMTGAAPGQGTSVRE